MTALQWAAVVAGWLILAIVTAAAWHLWKRAMIRRGRPVADFWSCGCIVAHARDGLMWLACETHERDSACEPPVEWWAAETRDDL